MMTSFCKTRKVLHAFARSQGDKYERGSLFINFMVDLPRNGALTATQQRDIRKILTGRPTKILCPRTEET